MEPRHVCPGCDWPRQHSDETPTPSVSMADPNAVFVSPVVAGTAIAPHVTEVQLVSAPIVIPGQAPARLAGIADLGMIGDLRPQGAAAVLRSLTLAPDDPLPEEPAE